jgi:hypothetical protein
VGTIKDIVSLQRMLSLFVQGPGVITGSTNQLVVMETTPIYGNKSTSVNGPYASVPGINNAKDYTPGILLLLLTIEEQ